MQMRHRLTLVPTLGLALAAVGLAGWGATTLGWMPGLAAGADTVAAQPETSELTIADLLKRDAIETPAEITPPESIASEATGSIDPKSTMPSGGKGPVTGFALPRFVSLKADKINVRRGPSRDQGLSWTFQRSGWPVEIIAEFETWRRIRDSDGQEGWVQQSMLSGRRMVAVAPWSKVDGLPLKQSADDKAQALALLQPGVMAQTRGCDGIWCRIEGSDFDGYIRQTDLWGVYPGETVAD